MGEEIDSRRVAAHKDFVHRVSNETKILRTWFEEAQFSNSHDCIGFELEGCLVDENLLPALSNAEFLCAANEDSLVTELAKFNFEFNSPVYRKTSSPFRKMHADLKAISERCNLAAHKIGANSLWVGILPTLRDDMLSMQSMTESNRYYAITERIMELREQEPLKLTIERFDSLEVLREDIMTEAAATSLQIHNQVNLVNAKRYYNASLLITAPCTALMANSPFLYGQKLWDETRIPVFEQSLALPKDPSSGVKPVDFASGYIRESLFELFAENIEKHRPILPVLFDDVPEKLRHLKFFNGQIWRWVRPIVGVDYGSMPHLRIEQRAFPAGPSNIDTIANIAFYTGLLEYYGNCDEALEDKVSFADCRKNFYDCAQLGMKAEVTWLNGKENVQSLLMNTLLEQSKIGLESIGTDKAEISLFIDDVIKNRIKTGWNGAAWQKSYIDCNGRDFQAMSKAYLEWQKRDVPVYTWKV